MSHPPTMDSTPTDTGSLDEQSIAVVGMAAHLPGAGNVRDFWRNLTSGTESIRRFSDEELAANGVDAGTLRDPAYVKAGAVLDDMEWFDAAFFGLSPRDAAIMDPQTRHFLECAWHALEDAGHVPETFEGNVGVFAGAGAGQYFWRNIVPNEELMRTAGFFLLRHTGNDKDFLATRASYELDLTGPSVGIQTACSTSLVAIHYACQSLLSWECDMALAGGVTIEQPHRVGYLYKDGEILSPDGHCRSYDHRSEGAVFGSGAGVVVLRRLADALADGDTIHAVIRGSAVNNDGATKVSYLAPSVDGQAKAIAEALSVAGVSADTIGFVEGHGTATPVGDPIEVAALTQAFRAHTDRTGFCALGSVKSNIGHLDTAAGVASFIKAVLALKEREIPPTVHFERPNPLLQLDSSPFFINDGAVPWPEGSQPRRAAVNSLGVGGTNAHVILEEAPQRSESGPSRPWRLLTLSGRSAQVLEDASRELVDFLESSPGTDLADVSYTLRRGRRRFEHRKAIVCSTAEDAIDQLAGSGGARTTNAVDDRDRRDVAFLFAGGGAQYPHMGRELYEREGAFREVVDVCLDRLRASEGLDLEPYLFPEEGAEAGAAEALQRPSLALPALFTIQYAQARLWMSWGIRPSAMIGHSMGEYTAACLAGVFSLEDALALVALRGRLFETVGAGAMLSVSLDEASLRPLLGPDLSIAAVNAPEVVVASGPVEAIAALQRRLGEEDIDSRRIHIDVAAHSSMLEPVLEEFGAYVESVPLSEPEIPVISNLSGDFVGRELTDPRYWVRHLRETVRFSEGVGRILGADGPVLLEVGPGRTLSTVARMHPGSSTAQPSLTSMPHPGEVSDAQAFQLVTLGALWTHGVDLDWTAFDGDEVRRRVSLPGYPFDRAPHFVQPTSAPARADIVGAEAVSDDPASWFQQRTWVPTAIPPAVRAPVEGSTVLVLTEPDTPGDRIAQRMERSGGRVIRVRSGPSFGTRGDAEFELRPGSEDDWRSLIVALAERDALPSTVIHAWALGGEPDRRDLDGILDLAFFAPLHLFQAVEREVPGHAWRFVAATSGLTTPATRERAPWNALLGPIRVGPREIPSLRCRLVDFDTTPPDGAGGDRALDVLVSEVLDAADDAVIAYRGGERLAERFTGVPLPAAGEAASVRTDGVYLLTGGLGGIGLEIARELATGGGARLAFVGRGGLPPRDQWPSRLEGHDENDKTARAIREVERLEAAGAEVAVYQGDVTDEARMREIVGDVRTRFGTIHGVVHAAGVLDDGPLLARGRSQAMGVLAPKIRGALVLGEVLRDAQLDFFFLFSSVSAVIGAPGQIDYTAANAVLDAFARARSGHAADRVASIAWSAWRDVGMAAELAGQARYGLPHDQAEDTRSIEHPVFEASVSLNGTRAFRADLSRARHWMLDEHRVRDGAWVLPGSGYVELIRAGFEMVAPGTSFTMRDLVFLRPFHVDSDESRALEVRFAPEEDGWAVTVAGKGHAREWLEHATASIRPGDSEDSTPEPLSDVLGRVGPPQRENRPAHPVMEFGPRWQNLVGVSTGDAEAVLSQDLPAPFRTDLEASPLHPALLDMATAGAQHLIPGVDPATDFFIPAGYGHVRLLAPLKDRLTSHVRLRDTDDDGTFASFDITIYDADARVLATIDAFSMIRASGDTLEAADGDDLPRWLRDALSPDEGVDAFRRILGQPTAPHVLVAKRPVGELIAEADATPVRSANAARTRQAPTRGPMPAVAEALQGHPAVKEVVAIGGTAAGEPGRVVAFIVQEPGSHATVSELRRFARGHLERSLVPQQFVEVVSLPRTADGAPAFEELRDPFAEVDQHVPPRTATEKVIADIWVDLLGLDRAGIHDNFLDVGGHSLVGIRVLLRIQQTTGVRIEANALTMQTLEQIAAEIDRKSGRTEEPSDVIDERQIPDEPQAPDESPEPGDDSDMGRKRGFLSRVRKAIADR